ncbi:MAG: protein-L-isoaspartate O-methyltransferase [Thermoplasmata archaeon]|nr:protein-L-isoaspartate O-methyltransferase [Thermoplasmata archaeon]
MIDLSRRAEALAMVRALGLEHTTIGGAMERVPRHRFAPLAPPGAAYEDEPIPLAVPGATVSAPHMVALQLERASLGPGDSVLEVGSGSGYLLALIADLVGPKGRVLGIEVEPGLVAFSRRILDELGYGTTVRVEQGDGLRGAPGASPFDAIIVSCAVAEIAPAWRDQLRADGRLVAPVGGSLSQRLLTVARNGRVIESGPECRFVAAKRSRDAIYRPAN